MTGLGETMGSSFMLSGQVLLPLVGVICLACAGSVQERGVKILAGLSGLLTFLWSVFIVWNFDASSSAVQFSESYSWVRNLGITFTFGIDGISVWFLPLTTLLTFLVLVSADSVHRNMRAYLISLLLLEVGMLGTFVSLDAVSFYLFWELMLVPMYFLIGVWGGARKTYAAIKFVLYTALGSLLMLVAIVWMGLLYQAQFGQASFLLSDWIHLSLSMRQELWLFAAFAFAFAIKVPVFPLHTWLPDAHVEAPTGGSVILAGILLKMGLYGLIRFGIPLFPHATVAAAPIFIALALIGIVFGALVAWVQTDMKKLVAYSSVSHLGFCVLGYAVLNFEGLQGCILQMINHGISTGALFFLVGVLYDRKHTRAISDFGGLAVKVPLYAMIFLIFTLSSIGFPLTNGFVGEFLIIMAGFHYHWQVAAVAASGVVLGALYMLSLYRRVMFGPMDESKNGDLADLSVREKFVFAPLLVLVFFIGLVPQSILHVVEPSARSVLSNIENSSAHRESAPRLRQFGGYFGVGGKGLGSAGLRAGR